MFFLLTTKSVHVLYLRNLNEIIPIEMCINMPHFVVFIIAAIVIFCCVYLGLYTEQSFHPELLWKIIRLSIYAE